MKVSKCITGKVGLNVGPLPTVSFVTSFMLDVLVIAAINHCPSQRSSRCVSESLFPTPGPTRTLNQNPHLAMSSNLRSCLTVASTCRPHRTGPQDAAGRGSAKFYAFPPEAPRKYRGQRVPRWVVHLLLLVFFSCLVGSDSRSDRGRNGGTWSEFLFLSFFLSEDRI